MVDLHMHSTASDGSDSIRELLEKVRGNGIKIFSVTDHDTVDGTLEMETIVPEDMFFIKGIEFSSVTEAGKCHILGYDFDHKNEEFRKILAESKRRRIVKTRRRIDFLEKEFGITLTDEELAGMKNMEKVSKPYLGNLLVSKGIAGDRKEAIKKFIDPCKTEDTRLDGTAVINAILSAGGIPVWAHPLGGTEEKNTGLSEFREQLEFLTAAGLKGLECYYSKYTEEQEEMLVKAADDKGLRVSGGSDYHGKNKINVCMGCLNASGMTIKDKKLTILEEIRKGR